MPTNIAVTGASGALGRTLSPYLLHRGYGLVCIDSAPPERLLDGAEYRLVDVVDYGRLLDALQGCDALIHLAAHPSPAAHHETVLYSENTTGSYNALSAAAILGITRVCLASSVNALGGAFSRHPRYDYFPVDEHHPSYAEDAYSLSKRVMELQADAFANRRPTMQIASLRLHWLLETRAVAVAKTAESSGLAMRHLWSYALLSEACRACLLALTADFSGHEVFFIAAGRTASAVSSLDLARAYYPETEIRGDLTGHAAFYTTAKAEKLLGWKHED